MYTDIADCERSDARKPILRGLVLAWTTLCGRDLGVAYRRRAKRIIEMLSYRRRACVCRCRDGSLWPTRGKRRRERGGVNAHQLALPYLMLTRRTAPESGCRLPKREHGENFKCEMEHSRQAPGIPMLPVESPCCRLRLEVAGISIGQGRRGWVRCVVRGRGDGQ